MKKNIFCFTFLLASSFIFLSCSKEPNVAPEADVELQSSIDASFANFIVTDIDMICSFIGENNLYPKFYTPVAGSPTFVVNRDPDAKQLSISFNKTKCADGRVRDGSIIIKYAYDATVSNVNPPNTDYYRQFGFVGRVSLISYRVDGWLVKKKTGTTYDLIIRNKRPNADRPIVDKISWTIEGKLELTDSLNTLPSITWEGLITKTLPLTADPKAENDYGFKQDSVFKNTPKSFLDVNSINWQKAKVYYTGSFTGVTSFSLPYSYKIYDATPVERNFTCYPDKVSGVTLTNTVGVVSASYEEFHPFVGGVASFTTSTKYPREIYFDNTANTFGGTDNPLNLPSQCDNKAAVQIKGIYYPIDLKK